MSPLSSPARRRLPGRAGREQPGPSAPAVPGLLVGAPVSPPVPGRPAAWWALDEDGHDVVVQRVRPAGGTGPGLSGLDEASLRRALPHPHLVPLLRVARCREGAVQVLGPAPGGTLADLLADGGVLRPGEVATLVAGIGTALAALHEQGLVHGEVQAAGVLVDPRGMPVLLGWGAARPVPSRRSEVRRRELRRATATAVRPEDDVRALARLGLEALGASVPPGGDPAEEAGREVLHRVLSALAADPAQGSPADQLARDCWDALPALPVGTGPPTAHGPVTSTAVTQRIRLGAARAGEATAAAARPPLRAVVAARLAHRPVAWAGAALGASAVIAAVLVGLVLPEGGAAAVAAPSVAPPSAASPSAGSTAAPEDDRLTGDDPAAAVPALSDLRLAALTAADASLLSAVDVPGSAAAQQDAAAVTALAGRRVEGLSVRVLSARVSSPTATQPRAGPTGGAGGVWVDVVSVVSAHRVVTREGVTRAPAGEPVASRLLLQRHHGAWRVAATA